ncbi:MAG TPA: magnesium transporter MgtC [Porphyromonadaceae bacterium]|jgi:putative Mg2+ transporter-C (MgtC) family protein|uniref:MgtC/SapB family protein n=1 Tax=Limibacterium fermenti TaxID=3229863 RepID=UPI000E92BAE7|nr:magnesium transporter MgtC [Porphyromonadaceae bacterium]HBK31117.1 magnesium transporter MgtC [Porphyromonadaceae bacterium]HBL33194.1 magnesium transporter MgtC [Porphyromonadaceae bacterium]HBX20087.1 magnesium transporter MgtC [Porphyromonadaceae bacterium]HBX45617.1 magnesium transporter MgtC [Porphyromonadaceae bacterium]
MEIQDFVWCLLAATAAGGVVGIERQINNKSAGLRTNTLVAVGACIYVLIGTQISGGAGDPARIIGQIITGIGFLGAGVILHRGANVQGLTTAATIWCSAALGCLSGLGMFKETLICTLLIVLINTALKKADKWFIGDTKRKNNPPSSEEDDKN